MRFAWTVVGVGGIVLLFQGDCYLPTGSEKLVIVF